jgi:hypothetical protein
VANNERGGHEVYRGVVRTLDTLHGQGGLQYVDYLGRTVAR